MKKLLVLAALAAMLLPLSCTKKNGENTDTNKPDEVVKMDAPVTKEAAIKIDFDQSNPPKYEDEEHTFDILSIELTEAQLYFLTRKITGEKVKSLHIGDMETIWGKYLMGTGGVFVLEDFGTVKWDKPTETVTVTIDVENAETGATEQYVYEAQAAKVTTIDSASGGVSVGANETTEEFDIRRTWKVANTVMAVSGDGVSIEAGFKGCDLEEMAKYAANNGISKLKNKTDEFKGLNVKYVSFTQAGTFTICFANQDAYDGTYSLNKDGKTLNYDFSKYSNAFFNGKASGSYQLFPDKKEMTLSLNVSVEGYAGTLNLNMQEEK